MSISYSECVLVALSIQHVKPMPHIAVCGLTYSTKFLHIISWKTRFSKKYLNIKRVIWISKQTLSEIFLILGKAEWDIITNALRSFCTVPDNRVRFQLNLNTLDRFQRLLKYQNPWKSVQLEQSCSMRKNGRTFRHDRANNLRPEFWECA